MIGVVVPVLNEREGLAPLYQRLAAAAAAWGEPWELLFVDDGSTDGTFEEIERLHGLDPRVKRISFSRNFGHQTAVTAGMQYAGGDAVVILDADLQDPPEVVARFIEKWREGYQVVYGIRTQRKEGWLKRAAYFTFYRLLSKLSSVKIPLDSGDFCLMDRTVVDALIAMPERNRFVRGLRSWVGYRQVGVPYEREARFTGKAKYTFRKLMGLAFDGLVNFSYKPLTLIAGFGFLVALGSFLAMLYTLAAWLFDLRIKGRAVSELPGYTTIALSVLFIGGVQLVSLGILGEYVGRIFDEVKQRPLFIVRAAVGLPGVPTDRRPMSGPRDQGHPASPPTPPATPR
jgi:dolichol-phosphate mannosyltransferase